MKSLVLSILIGVFLAQNSFAQERDDVRKALLGNDPNTTLTTGVGQAVQPVGTPVVRPPGAPPPAPIIQPTLKQPKSSSLERGLKARETTTKDRFSPTSPKVEGTYELGELPEKPSKDQKSSKKLSASEMLFSNQIVGGSEAYGTEAPTTIPVQKTKKVERIRIPYSKPPPVQRIPYR